MFLHRVKDYSRQFDVVVFDEDVLGQFIEEVRVREPDVRQVADMLRQLREDLETVQNPEDAAELTPLLCFLEGLAHFLAETRVMQPISGAVLHQRLDEAHQTFFDGTGAEAIPLTLAEALRAIPPSLDNVVDTLHFDVRDAKQPVPLQFLNALLPVLRYELFERDPKSNLSRLHFQTVRVPVRDGEPSGRKRFSSALEVVFKADPPPLPTPTIILDATGKPEIYERLFGVAPLVYAPAMKLENQVTQVYSTSGSYGVLRQAVHRKRTLEILASAVAQEPRTLVVCKQGLEAAIRPLLPPDAGITHFYGNRGSNAFKDYRQVVIFGMPGMTPDTIRRFAGALFWEDNLCTDTELVVRRYRGHDVGVQVLVYQEPLIQAVAETAREDEVLQSIHRIRPGLDDCKQILLVTNLVVPDLPVTRLVSASDLRAPPQHSESAKRLAMLVHLAQAQFQALGFVCPARTLWLVAGQVDPSPEAVAYMQSHGAWHEVPPDQRVARTTLHQHKDEIREASGFTRFEVQCRSPRGRAASEIWGRDDSCLEAARRYFAGHPANGADVLEIVRN